MDNANPSGSVGPVKLWSTLTGMENGKDVVVSSMDWQSGVRKMGSGSTETWRVSINQGCWMRPGTVNPFPKCNIMACNRQI